MRFCAVGLSSVLGLVAGVQAGTVLWTGSFNSYATSADFDKCEWILLAIVLLLMQWLQGLGRARLESING